nr:CHAT domain-containing protein [Pyrinomonadaceae bacterium]
LMLAKIGATQYLAGDEAASQATFAQMTGNNEAAGEKRDSKKKNAAVIFAALSASAPGMVCPSFNSNSNTPPPMGNTAGNAPSPGNAAGNGAGSATGNSAPPNFGHAPKGLDGIGRMDLRVVDQDGNPVPGVKAQLATKRPNGINCDCWENTDQIGRAVLPPIHVGKVLKLALKAKGFESVEMVVDPQQMAEPFKVVMRAKGALPKAATAAGGASPASAANAAASSAANNARNFQPPACFGLYSLFNSYVIGQFGLGRGNYSQNRLAEARANYENVLAAADATGPVGNLAAARLYRVVAQTNLGDVAFKEGRYADAIKLYTSAADGARQDNRPELVWGAYRGIGKSHLALAAQASNSQQTAQGREESLKAYRLSLASIELILDGSLRADEARAHFLATTKDVFDEATGALAEMALVVQPATATIGGGSAAQDSAHTAPLDGQALAYAAEAFKIAEQGRARALLDVLGAARAEITEGVPATLAERKAANLARQYEIAELLRGTSAPGHAPTQQSVVELEKELERLNTEYNNLENQIRTSNPRYAQLARTQPLALAEVQRQVLDAGTSLLVYSLGRERSYLWAVTQTKLQLFRLPARAELEQQVIALREQMIPSGVRRSLIRSEEGIRGIGEEVQAMTPDEVERGLKLGLPAAVAQSIRDYETASHQLYKSVLASAMPLAGDKRLLVVADGALNYVPFESFVTAPSAVGTDYSKLAYLVQTNEIIYAPSASVVAAGRQQQQAGKTVAGRGMLLVADPVFQPSDARVKGDAAKAAASGANRAAQQLALQSAVGDLTKQRTPAIKLARLSGTRAEANQIAKLSRASGGEADVWLDFDASEANIRQRDLSRYGVVHFATHGLLDAERPQFTGLALTLVGDTPADGFLRVGEVFNLRLGAPLVMLSACETGLGKEKRGEGVIGLTRAFMYAGAPTVGVSLWSVADRSTAELMPDFYKRLLASPDTSPSAAMRAAQVNMIAGKKYSAPFYWAPFVLVGDWR